MGVICYVLLAGYPPFYDEDQKKLFKKIKEAKYYFHEDYWSHISPDAMDLIRKMLCLDQSQRWTARQLLGHPWITAGDELLEGRDITDSLAELKRYNARRKLKAAADAVIMANRIARLTGAVGATSSSKVCADDDVEIEDGVDVPAAEAIKSEPAPPAAST
ncbi:unc-43 [Symbiodinium microadriaticum]|nr:unc-43 [Symbiodinium microadriaticum]